MQKETEKSEEKTPRVRTKRRPADKKRALLNRLGRIEGQIRGLEGMIERNAYCTDILIQAAAANAALNSFSRELLGEHMKTCVVSDIQGGKTETIDELLQVLQMMFK